MDFFEIISISQTKNYEEIGIVTIFFLFVIFVITCIFNLLKLFIDFIKYALNYEDKQETINILIINNY